MSRTAKQIHDDLSHPIIDVDAHSLEYPPLLMEYIAEAVGPGIIDRMAGWFSVPDHIRSLRFGWTNQGWYQQTPEQRHDERSVRPLFFEFAAENTDDYALSMLPKYLHENMEGLGLDFCVVYPTMAIGYMQVEDEDVRRAACRGFNQYQADQFEGLGDRFAPAAAIPMHTPEEAIEELEFAAGLGFKAAVIPHYIDRPIAAAVRRDPAVTPYARWVDTFGIDSEYDYDPFWAKCVELGIPPACHAPGTSFPWGNHRSTSMNDYNVLQILAEGGNATCKSLLMGGVSRRFPALRVAFLEGGMGWASNLYANLIGRWQKRNSRAVYHYDPDRMDFERLLGLMKEHAPSMVTRSNATMENIAELLFTSPHLFEGKVEDAMIDNFAACEVTTAQELKDLFVPNFYFGCEADDPTVVTAFNRANPFGARLNVVIGSDIGHADVWDCHDILGEAYEMVDDGHLSEDDFRDFTFANPARLYLEMNPDFFRGTVVEDAVAGLRGTGQAA